VRSGGVEGDEEFAELVVEAGEEVGREVKA
jgi:hypothetical protein